MSILRDKSVLHVSRLKLGVHRHWPNPRTENINHWFDSGIIRIAHINQSSMQRTWKRDDVYLFLDQATGSPDPTQSYEKHSLPSHPPNTIMESHTQKPCGHNWVHYISFSARFFIVLSCPNKVYLPWWTLLREYLLVVVVCYWRYGTAMIYWNFLVPIVGYVACYRNVVRYIVVGPRYTIPHFAYPTHHGCNVAHRTVVKTRRDKFLYAISICVHSNKQTKNNHKQKREQWMRLWCEANTHTHTHTPWPMTIRGPRSPMEKQNQPTYTYIGWTC